MRLFELAMKKIIYILYKSCKFTSEFCNVKFYLISLMGFLNKIKNILFFLSVDVKIVKFLVVFNSIYKDMNIFFK